MDTAKHLFKIIKTVQRSLQCFYPITKICALRCHNACDKTKASHVSGFCLLVFILLTLIVQAGHASNNESGNHAASLNTLIESTANQLPPIISLDKQQGLRSATNFIQSWQHGETQPTTKQWLSFDRQDWKQTTPSKQVFQHRHFRLTLFNASNEELKYTYQSHALTDNNISVNIIARSNLTQLNNFFIMHSGLQVLEITHSKVASFTLQPEQIVILAISLKGTYSGTPTSILQSQKDFNGAKDKTDRLALFISGALLFLLFVCTINVLVTQTYISSIGFVFAATSILTHSAVKPLIFSPTLQSSVLTNVVFTAEIISLTAFVALINWILVNVQNFKFIQKNYFYAASLLVLAIGLSTPSLLQELSLALNLCVSLTCSYFVIRAYFINPQRVGVLSFVFISATTAIIQIWLSQQYLNGHISSNRHVVYSMIVSAINITSVLTLLLYFIRGQQAVLSEKMRDAIKQEQKVATLSPLIHASRHDLRAPLSDIIGLSELVTDYPLDQQQRKNVYNIQSVAKNALDNINRIFSYHNNEENPLNQYRQNIAFHLTDLISECTNFYGHYFSESEQELIIDLADKLPNHLAGEHELFRQIFMHIIEYLATSIGNADACIYIQFDTKKGLLVQHTLASKSSNQQNNLPNQLQLIETLTKKIHGQFYIDNNHCQINLTLPMEAVEVVDQAPNLHSLTTGKRVLVVDDNPTSCNVISAYLQRWGISVFTAQNISEAQAIVRHQQTLKHSIDLAIVDYLLTNATGLDLVNRLLEDPQINCLMPVIIMSNAPDLIDTAQAKNYGIRHILEKPVLADTLKTLILEEFHLQQALRTNIEDSNQQPDKHFKTKFLLVEDNPISAKILTTMLDNLSVNYDLAKTAAEALALFYKQHYSLVLLDCELPDDSGFSVAKKMRTHQSNSPKQSALIALSADNSDEYQARALQAGMNEFIAKPLLLKQLNALVLKYIEAS